jgi:RNA polymerase sigma-70 factor (ECF subfamily)
MRDLTIISDEALLCRSAAGDEEAFAALYRRRQAGIYRFALHMSGNVTMAEEVTQEVFLTVIRDGKRFDESRGTAVAYLMGVARNNVLKALERNRAYIGLEDDLAGTEPAVDSNILSGLARAETIENVRQAVLELPAVFREAVVMCDLEEMSYAEAAGALGVPIGTVRSRISRGRALLVRKLSLRCFV